MTFLFDNNLSPKLARSLHVLVEPEHRVEHLRDRFPAHTPDVEWMRALTGEPNLVIVTADIRIGQNPHEVSAWRESGHTIFFLKPGWHSLDFWTQAWKFNKCFPDLIRKGEQARPGSAFIVAANGKIES